MVDYIGKDFLSFKIVYGIPYGIHVNMHESMQYLL